LFVVDATRRFGSERTTMTRIIDTNRFRDRSGARNSGGSDRGNVDDDVLKRLGAVESVVGDMREDVSAIAKFVH